MIRGKRNVPPPYEVMGGHSVPQSASALSRPAPPPPRPAAAAAPIHAGPPVGDVGPAGRWSTQVSPIVLRLSPPIAVLSAIALILLLILAFWVGSTRGYRRAMASSGAPLNPSPVNSTLTSVPPIALQPAAPAERPPSPAARQVDPAAPAPPAGAPVEAGASTGRMRLVVANYHKQEAQRLVQFLKRNQVDAQIISYHNGQSCLVVDTRGFTAGEVYQPAATFTKRKQRLIELGRYWRDRERGSSDLSDMWAKEF